MSQQWETIIGLELHVQLNTLTKLFSSAPNRQGQEPNVDIDPVSTGHPGTLPMINKAAVQKAVRLGLAIGAHINLRSHFDRKSYFYPDSPRNFQITQFTTPLLLGGMVEVDVEGAIHRFQIERAHLEDDAGMLKHFSNFAGIDYNRAGVPLIEIVSAPCFRSPQEASCYVAALKAIIEYGDIGDCNMERGNLRIDANISVRPFGERGLRNKVEIKNLNSLSNLKEALAAEKKRQISAYESLKGVPEATFRFDLESGSTLLMREKSEARDYRFFQEPDLPPLVIAQEFVETERRALPEMPRQKLLRYLQIGLTSYAAETLIQDRHLASFFEMALSEKKGVDPRALCNWITVELAGRLKESGTPIYQTQISPHFVAELVEMVSCGQITGKIAKAVADDLIANPTRSPQKIVKDNPAYRPIRDEGAIDQIIDEVLELNRQSIRDYFGGKDRAFGYLVGQIMKRSRGSAAPGPVNEQLAKKLKALSEKKEH